MHLCRGNLTAELLLTSMTHLALCTTALLLSAAINPFSASCSTLILFEAFRAILVYNGVTTLVAPGGKLYNCALPRHLNPSFR